MDWRRAVCTAFITAVAFGAGGAAFAQQPSARPITVVAPFVSGTTDELVVRIVLGPVGQQLGQHFNVENRTGDDGAIGIMSVVKAAPDGQTLLLSTSAMSTAVILHKSLPYDALRDLEPVALFGGEPAMLVGAPNRGYANIADLVAAAKAKPGALKFASVGIGSASYLAGERFRLATGLNVQHVAFSEPSQALAALDAGRVDFYFIPVLPALPLISEGRVVPLAVTTPHRLQSLAGLPTLDEFGLFDRTLSAMVRALGAGKYTARHRRQTQHRDREGARPAGHPWPIVAHRLRASPHDSGPICGVRLGRHGVDEEACQRRSNRPAELTGAGPARCSSQI